MKTSLAKILGTGICTGLACLTFGCDSGEGIKTLEPNNNTNNIINYELIREGESTIINLGDYKVRVYLDVSNDSTAVVGVQKY